MIKMWSHNLQRITSSKCTTLARYIYGMIIAEAIGYCKLTFCNMNLKLAYAVLQNTNAHSCDTIQWVISTQNNHSTSLISRDVQKTEIRFGIGFQKKTELSKTLTSVQMVFR